MMIDISSFLILISSIVTYTSIYIILALSMNLEYGYTGVPNLGKVMFYFIGGIISARIAMMILDPLIGIKNPLEATAATERTEYASTHPILSIEIFIAGIFLSMIISGLFGYLASIPALALKEDFLALTLLIFGEAARIFVRTYEPIIGGVFGVGGIPGPFIWISDKILARMLYAILTLLIAIVVYIYIDKFSNSPLGRALKAVRDDDLAASVYGKDPSRFRGLVLFIGSSLAGLAGSLYVYYSQAIFPDDFVPALTFFILAMVLIGGIANNFGVVIGAIILSLFERFSQASILKIFGIVAPFDISYLRYMILGLLLIIILLFRPQGLIAEKPVKTPLYNIIMRRILNRNR